jgi:hypothetical protein
MLKKLCLIFLTVPIIAFSACKGKNEPASATLYVPDVLCKISTDNGKTYDENMKGIEIGKTFYLSFEISIKTGFIQNKTGGNKNIVSFSIAIPATEILDCTLTDWDGGVTSVPATDSIGSVVRYTFKALASNKPRSTSVIFQCRARDEGSQRLLVTFGDQVNEMYTKNLTMVYVKPEEEKK